MSASPRRARTRSLLSLAVVLGLLIAGLATTVTTSAAADTGGARGLYIVQLRDLPIAAYDGRIPGYRKTSPIPGEKVKVRSTSAKRYAAYLDRKRARVLGSVSRKQVVRTYRVALNGFAARMTSSEADALRRTSGVLAVHRNRIDKLDTSRTPTFLGLDRRNGLWNQVGGTPDAGKGVVVGIIDSGIWPESQSFAGSGPVPAEFAGDCADATEATGEAAFTCNSKLVVAKAFRASFAADELLEGEYDSPRDGDGHGSHTASTAAGNHGVEAVVEGKNLGRISGMAPAAMVAAYKVCWNGDQGGCGTVDSASAIDAAISDGVDVLNFSISGTRTGTINDPVENAFLFAAEAGVFIATSAGNSGPTESTVAHNSPWLTTVAAGTHDRDGLGSVTLGNGATYEGKSITAAVGPAPLVNSTDAVATEADPAEAELCVPGTLDPATVSGKIVTCARGVIGRTDKSLAVREAGGVGMVLYNLSPSSVNADLHFVPTVHVDEVAGAAIVAYAETAGATASLAEGRLVFGVPAPDVATFSSRGPALASGGDLLKPDIMAPGVDVLAAVAPPGNHGRNFDFYSGTSMSSPHIAGIGALMKDLHGDWSPAAIKSAMMTTAGQRRNVGGLIPGTPFDFGAGQVKPNTAGDPGLVYDAGFTDWVQFACGSGDAQLAYGPAVCDAFGSIDPSDLNYPSIAIGSLAGTQTVSRTVTNVSGKRLRFTADIHQPIGLDIDVFPKKFAIAAGATKTFDVRITRRGFAFNEYAFGSIEWENNRYGYLVRSPVAVRPVPFAAPEEVSGSGTSGSATWEVTSGYTGTLQTRIDGLTAATTATDTYADGQQGAFDIDNPMAEDDNPAVHSYTREVGAGTTYGRWATFADASSAPVDDIDLYVYRQTPAGLELVGASASGSSDETVSLPAPEPGTYVVYVHNWDSETPTNDITMFQWLLDGTADGNATVTAPSAVTLGETYEVSLAWSGLTAGTRYLGRVVYDNGTADIGETVVGVTT